MKYHASWRMDYLITGILCVLAAVIVALAAAKLRFGEARVATLDNVSERAKRLAPKDWPQLREGSEWRWPGVRVRTSTPACNTSRDQYYVTIWEIHAGWPFPCMAAEWKQDQRELYARLQSDGDGYWALNMDIPGSPLQTKADMRDDEAATVTSIWTHGARPPRCSQHALKDWIPLRPIPAGIALNAGVYAIGTACIIAAWRRFRTLTTARRENDCVTCGYDLSGVIMDRCPECGRSSRS